MNIYQTIYSRAKAAERDTVGLMMELVRTRSFSAKEKDCVELVRREMIRAGLEDVRIDGLGNVIGRIGRGDVKMAFDGHVDTVHEGDRSQWGFDPFSPKIDRGKVWGRGSVDQKGGLAAMIAAAGIIRDLGLNDNLTIYFTGTVMEEECDGLCWQYLIREENILPDFAILTEPTNMHVYRGHRGRMDISIEVKGRSAHSSSPELGDNAIYKIGRIILEIEKMDALLPAHGMMGKGSVAVTEIASFSPSTCAIPDGARIRIDRRLTMGESRESALDLMKSAVEHLGYDDVKVTVLTFGETAYTGKVYPTEKYYPTWMLDENSPFLKNVTDTYHRLFGISPQVGFWTYSSNAVALAGMHGVPCVICGPGDERYAHAPNEACDIDQVTRAAAFYAALVAKMSGKS